METEKPKHTLSIFLIKENYEDKDKCLKNIANATPHRIQISGTQDAYLYVEKSHARPPEWHKLFLNEVNWKNFKSQSIKGILHIQSKSGRWFAITFGYGKSFLNPFAFEENFGFKTVINSIDPDALKTVEKKSIIENPLFVKEQITKNTDLSQFNVDEFTDFLSKIKGQSKAPELGISIDGKDSLRITVDIEIEDIPDLLDICLKYYSANTYKLYFPEIDKVIDVRDKEILLKLENILIQRVNKEEYDLVWTSIPEFYDEDHFDCFHYSSDRKEVRYYDIELKDYIKTKLKRGSRELTRPISKATLKRDHIILKYKTGGTEAKWNLWKCIYTEVSICDRQYIFYDGLWYLVGQNYIEGIAKLFDSVPRNDPSFPPWNDLIYEKDYLKSLDPVIHGEYCLMDRKNIQHGGRSKIEFCDLYTDNKELIHVKKFGGSSVLSHLFKQGEVSASLLLDDKDFRYKVENLLADEFTIDPDSDPQAGEYTIWFVIGTKHYNNPNLPLFSRIAFVNTYKLLRRFRYKVKIGYVSVEKIHETSS